MQVDRAAPIEPVAPRMVTLRSPAAERCPSMLASVSCHHVTTSAGRAPALRYRRGQGRSDAASTAAATKPSRRSISPPWPGIKWPESLAPKRRFSADLNRSPACARSTAAQAMTASAAALPISPADRATRSPASDRAERSADGARPGFFRADARRELRTADRAADEISDDVGRPDDGEQEQRWRRSRVRCRSAARSARCRMAPA